MSSVKLNDLLKIGDLDDKVHDLKYVTVETVGTASSTTTAEQAIGLQQTYGNPLTNKIMYAIAGTKYMEQDVLLSTSDVTIATFTNAAITANSDIEVSVSDWSCVPENVSAAAGTCAVTLPKVDTAATVRVRIYIR